MSGLKIKNIKASYIEEKKAEDDNVVIKNFSLDINEGELAVLLGPSGCGKSTLLTLISGLKDPDKGSISYNNRYLFNSEDNINIRAEERNVGFVFQSYALWPHMTVYQNIEFPLKARKLNKEEIKKRINNILDIVNMQDYRNRYPTELSGGEKQRIALARSLVYQPGLLLLDEPLANLDANLKTSLITEIKQIQRKLNITTIYVTHDQQEAFEIADKIIVMNEGEIMQVGKPSEIYNNSQNRFVAEFIGKNNIFDIKDNSFPPRLRRRCRKPNISIRPEDIIIEDDGEYTGIIRRVFYKGNHTEYIVEFEEHRLLVHSGNNDDYQVGDKISFNIKKYHSF